MVDTAIGAAGIVHGIGARVDGNMGQTAAGIGEHDNVTGNQVGIGGGGIGVPGHAAAGLGSQIFQARFPCPHTCGGIGTAVHGSSLDRVGYPGGVYALDVGEVIVPVVRDEGGAHQALLFKQGDIGCLAAYGAGIGHGLVAVAEGRIIIVADIGKHLGRVGLDIGGSVLCNIQVAVVLQVIHVIPGIGQGAQYVVVVHFIRDQAHIRQQHDPIGVSFQQIVRKIIVHGQTVGIRPVGIVGVFLYNGVRGDKDTLGFFRRFGFLRGLRFLHGFGLRLCGLGFLGGFLRGISRFRRLRGIGLHRFLGNGFFRGRRFGRSRGLRHRRLRRLCCLRFHRLRDLRRSHFAAPIIRCGKRRTRHSENHNHSQQQRQ